VVGIRLLIFSATGSNREGEILLFVKPCDAAKVICRPALHAGEVTVVKSPASIAGVGIYASDVGGSERSMVA
jgi:hypothetical protein